MATSETANGHASHTSMSNQPNGKHGSKREITILVTGFDAFQSEYPINPSYEITRQLPPTFSTLTPGGNTVRIITYADPIRVSYSHVHDLIPKLHTSHLGKIDLILHIGMASGRKFYAIERFARRDGYVKSKDVDGAVLPADDGARNFPDCPPIMTTSLNFDLLLARWLVNVQRRPHGSPAVGADCRMSADAGRYLCDYIYFNSLAWFARRSGEFEGVEAAEDRPVMFLHVPPESSEKALARGAGVTVALIEAMADTWVSSSRETRGNGEH